MSGEKDPQIPKEYREIDWEAASLYGDAGALPFLTATTPRRLVPEQRPIIINPGKVIKELKLRVGFEEILLGRVFNPLGLGDHLPGSGYSSYGDRLEEERRKKGLEEAAFFGTGEIGGQKVVVFGIDYDFMGGSLSRDGGERYIRATEVARDMELPLVALFSSGGARQQEEGPALMQIPRMIHAADLYNQTTPRPHVAVLIGQVWGGTSAAPVPMADVRIGLKGTNFGFSGPRVIEGYTRQAVPEGAQSVEEHIKYGNVDVLVQDSENLLDYLAQLLRVTDPEHARFAINDLPEDETLSDEEIPELSSLEQRYLELRSGTKRFDTKVIIESVFSESVGLYSSWEENGVTRYPAIIAAIGKIGPQPFLIIGNQHSYYRSSDGDIRKIPSSPEPKDYQYAQRMLEFGKRLKLPVVLLTDTLGAKPTVEAERMGQAREIAYTNRDLQRYPYPTISIITGALGSGGGVATSIGAGWVGMLSNSMLFVAEPSASATIRYKTPNTTPEQIQATLETMSATAQDQERLGIIDEIIYEGDKKQTADRIRHSVAEVFLKLNKMSEENLIKHKSGRMMKLAALRRLPIRKRFHRKQSDQVSG